jgi:hypothetical protein
MRQSSRLSALLPACFGMLIFEVLAGVSFLEAQVRYRTTVPENFRRAASASEVVLARIPEGTVVIGGRVGGDWIEVTLEGWIWSASVQADTQGDHDLRVLPQDGENLRTEASGSIVARLSRGALLDELNQQGNWIQVRRIGWMWSRSLELVDEPQSESTPPPPVAADSNARLDRAVTAQQTSLLTIPDGEERAVVNVDAPVRVLARSGDWVRVQTEGWIRETDLRPAAAGVLEGVTGAEVRASPTEFEGRMLQWTVQYLAIQEADELRSEIPVGQPYMLARGPLPEAGFVYVMIPPAMLPEVERLAPLAQLVIIGRIRAARSRFLGNPIVELVDMAIREQ